jgi:hypothetical protein
MFRNDIDVIRAVHSDRIDRDVMPRVRPEVAPRGASISAIRAMRRWVGRSFVRFGERIAAEPSAESQLRLAR